MRITTITAGLVASLALMSAPLSAMDNDHETMADKNAKVLNDVPMKVRDALIKEADGREISKVDRSEDNGKVVYAARIKHEGQGKDLKLKVDEDGKVVWRDDGAAVSGSQSGVDRDWSDTKSDAKARGHEAKRDVDRDVDHAKHHDDDHDGRLLIEDLPKPAREAFQREAGDRQIRDLDRSTKGGKTIYEGEVDLGNGKQREIKVDEDGRVIKSHED